MGFGSVIGGIAKELTLGAKKAGKYTYKAGKYAGKKMYGVEIRKTRRAGSTSRTSADVTLRARKAMERSRKVKYGRKRLSPGLSMRKKKGGKAFKANSRSQSPRGRRRSTKPGIRKGITGRTYSGTPMNRAAVTAAIAAAMKKRKKK